MTNKKKFTKVAASVLMTSIFAQPSFATLYPHVKGEIIIKYKGGIDKSSELSLKSVGAEIKKTVKLSYGNIHIARYDSNQKSLDSVLEALNDDPNVEYAEPNFIYKLIAPSKIVSLDNIFKSRKPLNYTPDDENFSSLWGLQNTGSNDPGGRPGVEGADINALKAWEITKGSKSVRIAVIDTGVDYRHPDLRENMWVNTAEKNGRPGVDDDGNGYVDDIHGYDFANNDGDPMDGNSHGTHCAGTIGASHDNLIGVAGVMADVEIVGVKFLTDSGSGSTETAIQSIDYATKMNVDIMSNSWGGGGYSQALKDAIQNAANAGIVFTAAAGNSTDNNDITASYPANYRVDNIISVASHTAQDKLSNFSSYGKSTVHIAAPGENILSTIPGNSYSSYSGTSMATPHVSGGIGLLLSVEGRLSFKDLKERLMETAVSGSAYSGKIMSGGRMDVYNLLTNNRPVLSEPDANSWLRRDIVRGWETSHPYGNNQTMTRTFRQPGAKFMRILVNRYQFETGYDFLEISDKNGEVVEQLTGSGSSYRTLHVKGDSVTVTFKSDYSVVDWGFYIDEIQYQ